LKLDGFHDIDDPNLASVLECRLSPQEIGLTQLSEREPFRSLDGDLKLVATENGAKALATESVASP
jgi:hypothetical protein